MYVNTSVRPLSREELHIRRIVLRDAIICIAWIKLLSIFCYTGLYFLVKIYSEGDWSNVIQYMTLTIIPIQILSAVLLFLGAIEVKPFALKAALWLSLFMAVYTSILGAIGAIYFIRHGDHFVHFSIAAIFFLLSFSVCSVFCHDSIVIYTFVKLLESPPPLPLESEPRPPIISYPPDTCACQKTEDDFCNWSSF